MAKIIFAAILFTLAFETVMVNSATLKWPFGPKFSQERPRRATGKENLPYDSAEMNLEAANELMVDILKDVDLLMEELHLVQAARKNIEVQRSLHEEKLLELLGKI